MKNSPPSYPSGQRSTFKYSMHIVGFLRAGGHFDGSGHFLGDEYHRQTFLCASAQPVR